MKKFRFRFETMETLRKRKEEDALKFFSESQKRLREAVSVRDQLMTDLNDALIRRENLGKISSPISVFQVEEDFIQGTKQRILRAEYAITRARKQLEKALANYRVARQKRRTMEMLRERDHKKFQTELDRKELKEIDDLYIMRSKTLRREIL